MQSQFDREIDRRTTRDVKWNKAIVEKNLGEKIPGELLPLWVADMDFATPDFIMTALKKRLADEIFGYCAPDQGVTEAIAWWQQRRFGWKVETPWIICTPNVVSSINTAVRAFSAPGDGVIIQEPVYHPFRSIVEGAGRKVICNALLEEEGYYTMDFEALEDQAAAPSAKLLILCSPHNPAGRVWKPEELTRLAEICRKHEVMVVTDEIHSDLVFDGHVHHTLLDLDKSYEDAFIYLGGPGKTFNIPGLAAAFAVIPNARIRRAFLKEQEALTLGITNTFGLEAMAAAYSPQGEAWLGELLNYLSANMDYMVQAVAQTMPGVRLRKPEGTYLCWLDFRDLGLDDASLKKRLMADTGVAGNAGPWFGSGGSGFLRLNAGCTRRTLELAMERLARGVAALAS